MNIMWGQHDMNNQYMDLSHREMWLRGCDSALVHLSAEMVMIPLIPGFINVASTLYKSSVSG